MIKALLVCVLLLATESGIAFAEKAYLKTSEIGTVNNPHFLKDYKTFLFAPRILIKEKQAKPLAGFMARQLLKAGSVETKQIDSPEGIELSSLDHPVLEFSLEQLVDLKGKSLPIIKATLAMHTFIETSINQEKGSVATNSWSIYSKEEKNVEKLSKEVFSPLLDQFLEEYQLANGKQDQPNFCVIDIKTPLIQELIKAFSSLTKQK